MCASLAELDTDIRLHQGKLHMYHCDTINALDIVHKAFPFQFIYSNRTFTVYAKERDAKIEASCTSHSIKYIDCEDYDLVPSDRVLMNEGLPTARPYTVLSHYNNKFVKDVYNEPSLVPKPVTPVIKPGMFIGDIPALSKDEIFDTLKFYKPTNTSIQKGGRSNGLESLDRIAQVYKGYSADRHLPGKPEGTTRLSAHLKFGTISIREFFHKILQVTGGNIQNDLTRELVFRSFYYKIWTHQSALQRDVSFHQKIDDIIPWIYPKDAPELWEAWTEGRTGYPMCDAGMRQLKVESYVHGRARMVLATVATRYLLFD